jgi:hypothetical protein
MEFAGQAVPISAQALDVTASTLEVGLPAIWAVLTVETSGCGFLRDRRPKILFERHKFHKLTDGQFDAVAPDLSNKSAGGHGDGGAHQYDRLERAMALDADAALRSASWGLGQIMGFNAEKVGYENVSEMIEAFRDSEDMQLGAMLVFIQGAGLAAPLRNSDWAGFAYRYNGADFQKNGYDKKLAMYHARYKAGPLPDLIVRWTQMALAFVNLLGGGGVDGWYGERTQQALLAFQASKGLSQSGEPDEATLKRLAEQLGWIPPI